MLDDASFTIFFHSSISLQCDLTVLNIQVLQASAIVCDALNTPIGNHITIS